MQNNKYLSNDHVLIACGVTLGITLGFILGAVIGFSKDKSVVSLLMGSKPEDWRLQWETLLGGLFALVAAALTVMAMKWQTRHLIERKEMATKAMLPLSFSAMIEYSESCLKYLRVMKGIYNDNSFASDEKNDSPYEVKFPEFPTEQIQNIKYYIENADQKIAEILAKYIATLQVHRSRMQGIQHGIQIRCSDNRNFIRNIKSSIIDAAEIYKFSQKILPFAQGHSKTISAVTSDEICSCLWWFIHFDYESDCELQKQAKEWTPLMDVSDSDFQPYSQKQSS